MKRSYLKRGTKKLNSVGKSDFQKAVRKLDEAVSILMRNHYEQVGCFTCGFRGPVNRMDCGHFRRREYMSTRFDPRNLGAQCRSCNRFGGGLPYEFGLKLDQLWGNGTAGRMYKRSKEIKQWTVGELEQLTSAAKLGWLPYLQLYRELAQN